MSIKKELRSKLSTSDQLKLSKSAREGGSDKFSFFETTGSLGSDFKAVYDLHMRIEALSKALVLYDMTDVFKILPESTVKYLESKLQAMYACQADESRIEQALILSTLGVVLLADLASSKIALASSIQDLNATTIVTTNLIKFFKDLDELTIRLSNAYYAKYGASRSVENLSWSSDTILNTCEDSIYLRTDRKSVLK